MRRVEACPCRVAAILPPATPGRCPLIDHLVRSTTLPFLSLAGVRFFAPSKGGGAPRATTDDETFLDLFEASEDPMVILDSTLRVVSANAAASRFLRNPI